MNRLASSYLGTERPSPSYLGMDSLTKKDQFERSKINVHAPDQMKCWAHALGVSKEELRKAVDKVGNSAAAVRKELETSHDERARNQL